MRKIVTLVSLMTILACMPESSEAAQSKKKKPNTPSQTKQKIDPYELCKQLVAKHGGAELRVQRYQITKDGTLRCWYMA